jgi:hypothetical protein
VVRDLALDADGYRLKIGTYNWFGDTLFQGQGRVHILGEGADGRGYFVEVQNAEQHNVEIVNIIM